ncbi:MAG: hypothetical protein Q8Q07_06085, partial [Dehalococcoidales bacterium]|nr:hypothetical protein [Dehalococcoidales bacterium]
ILLSQQHRVWARRILFTWVGAGGIITLGYMAWWIGPYKLYEMMQLPMTRGFLLVLATFSLAMIVVDKSFRTRFLKARWRYVVICWLLIITVSLVTSIFLAGSVEPFLSALAVVAGFVAVLFIFGGVIALLATALWYGCLKGSVIMLQVVAAGLRHIK